MRQALIALSLVLLTAACATTTPRKTVASLDQSDPRWKSRECVAARKAAASFDEQKDGRTVIALVGNLVVPFAGSGVAYAMDRMRDDERKALSHRVRAACVSDPLKRKGRRVAAR